MKYSAAALVFLFTLTTTVAAEAGQFNLKNQLRKSGVSMKIVKLDRTDGFVFGISFTGPQNSFVIAPGHNGMFLVLTGGSEAVIQRDTDGTMQILQTNSDLTDTLCIVRVVVDFLSQWTACEGDLTCWFTSILTLVQNYLACSSGGTTNSTTTIISGPVTTTTTTGPAATTTTTI